MPTEPPATGWVFPDVARCPTTAAPTTWSGWAPTSSPGRCWRPTGGGCSRCPADDPGVGDALVVAGRARRAAAGRAAGVALAAAVRAPDGGPRRHRVRRGDLGLRRPATGTAPGSTSEILAAYTRLHELGWAHSVEAWRDGELVGGLYGVAVGGLFAGESMFHRVTRRLEGRAGRPGRPAQRRARRPAGARRAVAHRPPRLARRGRGGRGRRTCGCSPPRRRAAPDAFR